MSETGRAILEGGILGTVAFLAALVLLELSLPLARAFVRVWRQAREEEIMRRVSALVVVLRWPLCVAVLGALALAAVYDLGRRLVDAELVRLERNRPTEVDAGTTSGRARLSEFKPYLAQEDGGRFAAWATTCRGDACWSQPAQEAPAVDVLSLNLPSDVLIELDSAHAAWGRLSGRGDHRVLIYSGLLTARWGYPSEGEPVTRFDWDALQAKR